VKAAPMHDLGKIGIPDAILRKPGRLTPEEYAVVRQHSVLSAQIITRILTGIENERLLTTAVNIAKYHHERVDGSGYPEGLRGDDIPLEARIMAIADVYDALVSERCYKAPMTFEQAFQTVENAMGTQFDEKLNPYFIACRQQIEAFYRG
jgi:HD-GYP domain-containing protein (c-di-GMP phosphodiesterase class II)